MKPEQLMRHFSQATRNVDNILDTGGRVSSTLWPFEPLARSQAEALNRHAAEKSWHPPVCTVREPT